MELLLPEGIGNPAWGDARPPCRQSKTHNPVLETSFIIPYLGYPQKWGGAKLRLKIREPMFPDSLLMHILMNNHAGMCFIYPILFVDIKNSGW
ncbi:hypothetical protein [Serratia marcescens]|uniref:hypothetical protein n=1 Tax=Serratia marcescens TaxID=615 RepID=UPI001114F7C3|nr:hypothetical protein [Serratia marcescens]